MNALIIDAYDSFVHVIDLYLHRLGIRTTVVRNDKISPNLVETLAPDLIVLGPGPGHPRDAHYVPLIRAHGERIPILGVCLGHQAIGLAFGAEVVRAKRLLHGKSSLVQHDGRGMFASSPAPLSVVRYHSLAVAETTLPECLEITARATDDGTIMGLRHRTLPIESVQFHPESIGTEDGLTLFRNFIRRHVSSTNPEAKKSAPFLALLQSRGAS